MNPSRPFLYPPALLILLVALLGPGSVRAETAKALPRISIEKTSHNFGQIFSGEKASHVFSFSNSGGAPLVIEKVRHSCGCTATVLSSTTLAPGATGQLQSTFSSTGFFGEVVKTIYLYSNDPDHPVVQLHLRGVVQQEIVTRPNRVSLDKMIPEKTVTSQIKLVHNGKNNISFGPVQTTTAELKAELSSTGLSPGGSATVTLAVTPQPGKRRFGGFVIIPLHGAHAKEIRIPVYASVAVSPSSQTPPSQP